MKDKILKQNLLIFGFCAGLIFLTIGALGAIQVVTLPDSASAASAASSTVTVSATVNAYLSLAIDNGTAALGTLIDSSGNLDVGSSTFSATVNTNDGAGYTLSIEGTNDGLSSSTDAYVISTVSTTGSTTIAVGTDGYGATASSTHSTVYSNYFGYGTLEVGAISSTTAPTVAAEAAAGANRVTEMMILATTDSAQPAGTYSDTVWITATGQTP